MKKTIEHEKRKKQILDSAIALSKRIGYSHITRDGVAREAKVSNALPSFYFNRLDNLKKTVVKEAIQNEILEILAEAFVRKDKSVVKEFKKSEALKRKVFDFMFGE